MKKLSLLFVFLLFGTSPYQVQAQDIDNLVRCPSSGTCQCPDGQLAQIQTFGNTRPRRSGEPRTSTMAICHPIVSSVLNSLNCVNNSFGEVKIDGPCNYPGENCSLSHLETLPPSTIPQFLSTDHCPAGTLDYQWPPPRGHISTTINQYLNQGTLACKKSMCTSATFLALAAHAKEAKAEGKIDNATFRELTRFGARPYQLLNAATEPNTLVEEYGLGSGHIYNKRQGSFTFSEEVPAIGDLMQIWRTNGQGHSVIYSGSIDENNDGKPERICYWSSQGSTDGYGYLCERASRIRQLRVGHFE